MWVTTHLARSIATKCPGLMTTSLGWEEEVSRLPTLSRSSWGASANNFWNPGKSRSAVVSKWVICFNLLCSLAKFDVELVGKCRSLSRSGHMLRISSRAAPVLVTCRWRRRRPSPASSGSRAAGLKPCSFNQKMGNFNGSFSQKSLRANQLSE